MPAVKPQIAKSSTTWAAALIVLGVGLATTALYFVLRSADKSAVPPVASPAASPAAAASADGVPQAPSQEQIQAMVVRLAARLEKAPDDGPGWQMLGRSYANLGRFAESAKAYGRAVALLPADADLFADYADVLAMAQSGSLRGEPLKFVRRALEINPNHVKALALAASEAFERKDYRTAVSDWNKALAALPPGSAFAASIRRSIAEAEALGKGAGGS